MRSLIRDVRYGLRTLARTPGFTAAAVLTLALGIGANTAIFSFIHAVLLRDLPVEEPGRVVAVYTSDYSSGIYGTSSYPDYADLRQQADSFSGLAAYADFLAVDLKAGDTVERIPAAVVTPDYFQVLGVEPELGRAFVPGRDPFAGPQRVAVLGFDLWQSRFGADPDAVGTDVRVNGTPFRVVGVAPRGFFGTRFQRSPGMWVPMSALADAFPVFTIERLEMRGGRWLRMVGRLRPGVTLEEARAEVATIADRLGEAYPDTNLGTLRAPDRPRPMSVVPSSIAAVGPVAREFAVRVARLLMVVVGSVLIIACANIANLLLVRARTRRQEIAVRRALGARRGRLVRQLLTESVLIAGLGGGAGLLVAVWLRDLLTSLDLSAAFGAGLEIPTPEISLPVLVFTAAVSLATALVFGLAPAFRGTRFDVVEALKETPSIAASGGRRWGLRRALVVVQVAVALVVLVGAGLFVRSLQQILRMDPGFEPDNLLIADVDPNLQGYDSEAGRRFYGQLAESVGGLPGIEETGIAMTVPVSPFGARRTVEIEGYEPRPEEDMELDFNVVSDGYFEAMGIELRRGRTFDSRDAGDGAGVVVVNEALAERYWPGEDPIGKGVGFQTRRSGASTEDPGADPWRVIGVVEDGKYRDLREDPLPYLYVPLSRVFTPRGSLIARGAGDPVELVAAVRAQLERLDPDMPLFNVRTGEEQLAEASARDRTSALLLTALGAVALLLASVGVFALISYSVERRARELGLRMALGARTQDVRGLVVRQGMSLVAVGVGLGFVVAVAVSRLLTAFLYDVTATDPLTFVSIPAILAVVALIACWLPAARATRIDPMLALRQE